MAENGQNGGRYVTWKELLTTTITLSSLAFGGAAGLMQMHEGHPHAGTVRAADYDRELVRRDERIQRFEKKLESIDQKLLTILDAVK